MMSIAFVTCSDRPEGTEDDTLAANLLGARWEVWDDPEVDWAQYELVVVRCPWDYHLRHDSFLHWVRRVPALVNQAPLVVWNTDKHYLRDLAEAGLPTLPTTFVPPGTALGPLPGDCVVKPAVSMGGADTGRFQPGDDSSAIRLVESIHESGRTAMLQPYAPSIDTFGETSLVYLDGLYSHAVRREPSLRPSQRCSLRIEDLWVRMSPTEPSTYERELGERVIHWLAQRFGVPAYARVDAVQDSEGHPTILELEAAEPYLFLGSAQGAAERFARTLVGRWERLHEREVRGGSEFPPAQSAA